MQVAGLLEQPAFTIRAFEDPPPELRIFMRLLNLKGEDAFLLEALFRQEAWGLISEPVSEQNEAEACATMINGGDRIGDCDPGEMEEGVQFARGVTGASLMWLFRTSTRGCDHDHRACHKRISGTLSNWEPTTEVVHRSVRRFQLTQNLGTGA